MEVIRFDRTQSLPIVDARIYGIKKSHKLRLVFDTGAETSIINTAIIEDIGYSIDDAIKKTIIRGPVGPAQEGYLLKVKALRFFKLEAENLTVGAFDFNYTSHFGAHGLLGFDVIKAMRLELDGPAGILKIF